MGANVCVPPNTQLTSAPNLIHAPAGDIHHLRHPSSFLHVLSMASRAYNSPWLDYDGSSFQCPAPLLALHYTPHFLPHGEKWTSTQSFFTLLGSSEGQIQNTTTTGSCQRRGLKSFAT